MPANSIDDMEVWAIISYLRSLNPLPEAITLADARKGEEIFFGKAGCDQCHMVSGRGGTLGPDLTRVGASRSREYLADSVREPSKELSDGMLDPNNPYGPPLVYDTVIAVTSDGKTITGVAKNEDTFSIQLLDANQQLHLLLKKNLKSVTHERTSLMPAYNKDALNETELHDIVAYLQSLQGNQ